MIENIPKKSLLTFGIYFLIFAIIIFLLLNPTLNEIEANKKNIIIQQKQLATNYDEIASLQKIEKDKTGFEQIKNTVLGYLPAILDSSQFIVEVEGLAKRTEITINSITMSATSSSIAKSKDATTPTKDDNDVTDTKKTTTSTKKTKGGTQSNGFVLSTKADFAKSMAFVKQLEKLSRFNSISTISITPTDDGVTIKLTGDIYYEQQ